MKILALDTATEACSAALLVEGRLVAWREAELERGHAEHILPMIDAVLAEGGVALGDVDAVAFGRGPGGFTGVRLAASVTQGLAFAAGRPVVPISDLAAVAQRALDVEPAIDRVVVCNDARMQEVYWGCFERDPQGFATLVGAEHVAPPENVELPVDWSSARAAPIGAIGRGFRAYPQLLSKLLSANAADAIAVKASGSAGAPARASSDARVSNKAPPSSVARATSEAPPSSNARSASDARAISAVRLISDHLLPRAHEIARLATREIEAGRLVRPEDAIPVYLRDDVARPKPPEAPPSRN
jgi:tRNA threonylcarbamoyladenosine biosynthesis protein TsaB